jgi:hypothetical protein
MRNREAIDTITGYFYQFDKTILELLKQNDDEASICIEGIEDIDVVSANEESAIQCKYYAKTEYNHSVIKKPIILMLQHFAVNKSKGIKYHLYGHYKSGHENLSDLTLEFLKKNFLTYKKTEKNENDEKIDVMHLVHKELNLDDEELKLFLKNLIIDIHAPSFEDQYKNIINEIKINLMVSEAEAELYHYNSALKLIKNISIRQARKERTITKSEFIDKIKVKDEIFDSWFIRRKGREKYIKNIKKQHLSSGLNMEAFDRFFLIDCCGSSSSISDIKDAIFLLSKKWSKISTRLDVPFCPSIYVHNLTSEDVVKLKNTIFTEGVLFVDAYPFKGSNIYSTHFYTKPTKENKIKFRFVDSIDDLNTLVGDASRTVEIYQFYKDNVFFECDKFKHVKIKVEEISYIKDLAK